MATAASLPGQQQHSSGTQQQQLQQEHHQRPEAAPKSPSTPKTEDEKNFNNYNDDKDNRVKTKTNKMKSLHKTIISVIPGKSRKKAGNITAPSSSSPQDVRKSNAASGAGLPDGRQADRDPSPSTSRNGLRRDGSAPCPLLQELFNPPAATASATTTHARDRKPEVAPLEGGGSTVVGDGSSGQRRAGKGVNSSVSDNSGEVALRVVGHSGEGSGQGVLTEGKPDGNGRPGQVLLKGDNSSVKGDNSSEQVVALKGGNSNLKKGSSGLAELIKGGNSNNVKGDSSGQVALKGGRSTAEGSHTRVDLTGDAASRDDRVLRGDTPSAVDAPSQRVVNEGHSESAAENGLGQAGPQRGGSGVAESSAKAVSSPTRAGLLISTAGKPIKTHVVTGSRGSRRQKGNNWAAMAADVAGTGAEATHMITSLSSKPDNRNSETPLVHLPLLLDDTSARNSKSSATAEAYKIQNDRVASEGFRSNSSRSTQGSDTGEPVLIQTRKTGETRDSCGVTNATGLDDESMNTLLEFESVIDSISDQAGLGLEGEGSAAVERVLSTPSSPSSLSPSSPRRTRQPQEREFKEVHKTASSLFGGSTSPSLPVPPRRSHKAKSGGAISAQVGSVPAVQVPRSQNEGTKLGSSSSAHSPPHLPSPQPSGCEESGSAPQSPIKGSSPAAMEIRASGDSRATSNAASDPSSVRQQTPPQLHQRQPSQSPPVAAGKDTNTLSRALDEAAGTQQSLKPSSAHAQTTNPALAKSADSSKPAAKSPPIEATTSVPGKSTGVEPTTKPSSVEATNSKPNKSEHVQPTTKPSSAEATNSKPNKSEHVQPTTKPSSAEGKTCPSPPMENQTTNRSISPSPTTTPTPQTSPTTTPTPSTRPTFSLATTTTTTKAAESSPAGAGGEETPGEELWCYNHRGTLPERYCADHQQPVCLECAFELHRSCRDVEGLGSAAAGLREELEVLYEGVLRLKARMEAILTDVDLREGKLGEERAETLAGLEKFTEAAIKAIRIKGTQLKAEAESLYANEEAGTQARAERVRGALTSLQEVQSQAELVLASGGQGRLLRQFGKLKGRCQALLETDLLDPGKELSCVRVSSTWFDDVKQLPPAKLTVERRAAVAKTKTQLSQRGLDTFRRICKKRRQNLQPDTYGQKERLVPTPGLRSGARASRSSLARSVTSSVSLPSVLSSQLTPVGGVLLDGPQSVFEFFAGLESDKYPFGLGDICVMQPRLTILITYLTSDLLRVFPWRQESSAFVSPSLGCALCCICQLSHETVAVTSSNSDQLSFLKVGQDSVQVTHSVSMGRQYRAVTSLDYRTLALATDSRRASANVIAIVRFDSADYRTYTALHTISARKGAIPALGFFSKTVFKVPYSLCTSITGHIVVSDSENKALLGLQHDGQRAFIFQPPKQSRVIDTPGGVACSPAGYLYLVDSCEQRVLRFDRSGVFRRVVLSQEDGLEWPIGVACVDESTLCVAEFYGQVKVFRIR